MMVGAGRPDKTSVPRGAASRSIFETTGLNGRRIKFTDHIVLYNVQFGICD